MYFNCIISLIFLFFLKNSYARDPCSGNLTATGSNVKVCNKYCEKGLREVCSKKVDKKISCQCTEEFALDKNNKCRLIIDCPKVKCKTNEEFKKCPSQCPATCADKNPKCNKACGRPACVCKKGYVLYKGKCTLTKKCPKVTTTKVPTTEVTTSVCPENMEWRNCTSMCPETCFGKLRACSLRCGAPKCVCKEGFVLSGEKCILKSQCLTTTTKASPVCPENMRWGTCPSSCPKTCDETPKKCPRMCTAPKCVCNEGFVLHNGSCITKDQCPVVRQCPENMEWQECPSKCTRRCNVQDTYCPKGCGEPSCVCKAGYVLYRSKCIKESDCAIYATTTTTTPKPTPRCPENMEWSECPSHCPKRCNVQDTFCPKGCAEPGCVCKEGFVLHKAQCIANTTCPKQCGEHMKWSVCPGNCEETCHGKPRFCDLSCGEQKCVCVDGYVKHKDKCIKKSRCPEKEKPSWCGKNEIYTFRNCQAYCNKGRIIKKCDFRRHFRYFCTCKFGFIRSTFGSCIPYEECARMPDYKKYLAKYLKSLKVN